MKPLNRFIFCTLILFKYIVLICIYTLSTRVSYTTKLYYVFINDSTMLCHIVINGESCYFAAETRKKERERAAV